jgi:hypothetical protein
MQRHTDGTEYAESKVSHDMSDISNGFEITYVAEPANGLFAVDMWKPDGDNHWTMTFSDRAQALREYNKWAKVPEEITT